MSAPTAGGRKVALLTLGCARNEVDSEELAGRLAAEGWELTDSDDADVVMVNTCGFVEQAKKDSVDTLLAAADTGAKVVAVGCLAERYGNQLAESLPEADAVLGFDDYDDIAARLQSVLAGTPHVPHAPRDRRKLLPVTPVERQEAVERQDTAVGIPGHAGGPTVLRKRLEHGPVAPLKLASGCDRRCSFCAIPSFRGSFVSRRPADVLNEARWLAADGVRELVLVSENSTSYGKDLGDPKLLETLIRDLADVEGITRVRVSYLQPAEMRPSLLETIARTPGVAPYFDLSFQHSSEPVLRRMRRFGSTERFVELLESARALVPEAGARSNFIVGFPGETEADVEELERFLTLARLDAVGVFAYSDEDGTEAAGLPDKLAPEVVASRYERVWQLAEELTAQRAEERIGTTVEVLIESVDGDVAEGRAAHQAPEVDGSTTVVGAGLRVGDLVWAVVTDTEGVDLVATLAQGALDGPA
jgi:ribosomal protein S12 methylthiotransferase RimO